MMSSPHFLESESMHFLVCSSGISDGNLALYLPPQTETPVDLMEQVARDVIH